MKNKVIYVLGGMGPEASMYMYKKLINFSIRNFGVKNNDDFPEIIIHSIPVPDFISNLQNKRKALEMLKERVRKTTDLNLSSLSIACNTAHLLLEELQKESKTPFVSMIEEVVSAVKKDGIKKIGILATPSTIRCGLYEEKLRKERIEVCVPDKRQLQVLEKIIRNVLKGELIKEYSEVVKQIADVLLKRGAEGIILGCTELPLIFPQNYGHPVYNSVEILSMKLLNLYYAKGGD